ncbi:MAG: IclR family transcriptional regulator [Chloroflexota bacterium]
MRKRKGSRSPDVLERVSAKDAPAPNGEGPSTTQARSAGRYRIGVLAKALDLVDLLDEHEALTLTELSSRSGINKVTVLRILANLEERGYVERDEATGQYRLGFRLLQLGMRKSEGLDLRTVARPVLKTLHAETGETVNLAIPNRDRLVYIDIIESTHGLRMAATIGARDDYHSTALGKAMLAYQPASFREELLARQALPRKTSHTIVEPGALQAELDRVREAGFAVDDEENEPGARCIAAPVFDYHGRVVAAISISGPASRVSQDRERDLATRVTAAARQISLALGFRPEQLEQP